MRRRESRLRTVVVAIILLAGVGVPASPARGDRVWDPWEPMNRGVFWFNDRFDVYLYEPLAKGWNFVVPAPIQKSIAGFFVNLNMPVVAMNNLLQLEPRRAGTDVTRLAINSTAGLGGFFDVATKWGFSENNEDLGQTLGRWGVPEGPYLVLPFLGPANPRDMAGRVGDSFATAYAYFVPFSVTMSARGAELVNFRSQNLDTFRQAKEAAIDYYVAVRDAYTLRRRSLVRNDTKISEEDEDDLYYFEEDDEE